MCHCQGLEARKRGARPGARQSSAVRVRRAAGKHLGLQGRGEVSATPHVLPIALNQRGQGQEGRRRAPGITVHREGFWEQVDLILAGEEVRRQQVHTGGR